MSANTTPSPNSRSGRIWDLRRGDADDNRTSPYGRGWRSVVVSTALDFNYLTASIAFVVLIIVPALLVGLAPPLLLTYGRQKLDAAAAVGSHPVAAVLSGNHDVNIVDRTNTGRFDLPWSVGQALRRLRFVVALDDVQSERVHIVDRASGDLGPSLRDYLQDGDRPELLRRLAEQGTWRGRWEIARVWDDMFPLAVPPTEPEGCSVILLDSNPAVTSHSPTRSASSAARS